MVTKIENKTIIPFGKYKGKELERLMDSDDYGVITYLWWLIYNDVPKGLMLKRMVEKANRMGFPTLEDYRYELQHKINDNSVSIHSLISRSSASYENSYYGHAFDYVDYH